MKIGIFAKTFARESLEQTLDAVVASGLDCVQFNLSCAGLPTLPERIEPDHCQRIRQALESRGIQMTAISGTFNMIHPDRAIRADSLCRLDVLAAACASLGTNLITLCTGTRDPRDMWRRHPENDSAQAWQDLLDSMAQAVRIAVAHGVFLGVEPEVANVVHSARRARRLLDELGSDRIKIVMDGANLFHAGELPRMAEILDEAFDLLGRDIGLAHAKDLDRDGEAGNLGAGMGRLDYPRYLRLLARAHYSGPLILHGLSETQVGASVEFLRGQLAASSAA